MEQKISTLKKKAADVRIDIINAVHNAGSGHPGGSLSAADIATVLYFDEMNVDPSNPEMKGRDKFVFSQGHSGPAQLAAMAERGYFPVEDFKGTLRKLGSVFQGHPSIKIPGIEMSTGSLGQGFSVAVGMAMANRMDSDPGRIYAVLGDGELQEGLIWEAAMAASHYKLDNMVAIIDHNGLQIDGRNDDVMTVNPVGAKFESFGWNVMSAEGNSVESLCSAFKKARECKGRPSAIVAETVKGKGVSFMENQAGWHGKAPNDEQTQQAIAEIEAAKAAVK
ncbi:MAG: transketolase [Clostridiales bacterium]|nr:transketolase [Clostridiales bacterium]